MDVIKQLIPAQPFALAISGGMDSVGVASYLCNTKQHGKNKYKNRVLGIHFNGAFIPQDDDIEASLVKICNILGMNWTLYKGVNTYTKGSKEDYCRKERYKAFSDVCKFRGIKTVVTAHTLDDCVTSYLWNCIRGHTDYQPIPFATEYDGFTVVRPFLLTTKKELCDYMDKHSPNVLSHIVEDEMNCDGGLTRNFLSNEVVPLIHTKKHFNLHTVVKKIVKKKLSTFLENRVV